MSGETMIARLKRWVDKKHRQQLTRRYGGTQTCPWCRQCAQQEGEWGFKPYEADMSLDVLTCGVCGGTSLWLWGLGMHWMGALSPPKPAWPNTIQTEPPHDH